MSNNNWLTSYEEYNNAIDEGNVVILFTAPSWCVPCQQFEPHWDRTVDVAATNNLPVKFYRVDLDDNDWVVLELGIRSVPTAHAYRDGDLLANLKVPVGGFVFLKELSTTFGV